MSSDEAFVMLDGIPSDTGSITSEAPSEDEIDADECIMNSTEDLSENRPDLPVPTSKEVLDYDSLLLATFIHQWTSNSAHANTPHPFQKPVDQICPNMQIHQLIFFCLFTKELIEKIVFGSNLYATQITNNNRFIPTTYDEI
ncbi:uncharacterized protein LOC108903588 [Anoplophora glabripennis]|uniref:uncharacterized protein LOC108903588 n=1 Tax=Anoplophora glabripennis TaxID=217634 RepID=UPI0008736BED|nr:uncharacterized protein LOC108903588 [Anoplophora glabripennis]